jgi:hypothetical protein
MSDPRALPRVQPVPVALGAILAVAIAVLIHAFIATDASIFGIAAPLSGSAAGAYLAGKMAKFATTYHGALVGVGYVLAEAIGLAPAPFANVGTGIGEGVAIIAGDALVLLIAALFGRLAATSAVSSSSSGKGRAR